MSASPIQRLHPHEGPRLRSLRLRALRDAPEAFASTWAETASRPPESWTRQLRELATFVATRSGADLGMVRGGPDHDHPNTAWLLSMWVAPEARGQGIGEALIEALVRWARDAGYARVLLEVGDHNTPAIALYARMGFVANGEVSRLAPPREHVTEHQRVKVL